MFYENRLIIYTVINTYKQGNFSVYPIHLNKVPKNVYSSISMRIFSYGFKYKPESVNAWNHV